MRMSFWQRLLAAGHLALLSATLLAGARLGAATELLPEEEGARLVLNRWVEAIGGPQAIVDLKWADYVCRITFGDGEPIPVYIRAAADGRYRYDYTLPVFGQLTQASDGRSAWQANDELGFGPLSFGEHVANQAGIEFREPVRVGSRFPHRRRLPDETVDGRPLQVLEMGMRDGWKTKWFFDRETGLRVRAEAMIGDEPMVIEYSDFRWFQRIREPYRIVRRFRGASVEVVRKSILYNEPSEAVLFSPPGSKINDHNLIERLLTDNDAIMGHHELGGIRTQIVKATTLNTSAGVTSTSITYKKRPNLLVRRTESAGLGVEWQGFDGKVGWEQSELQGFRTMQGPELQQMIAGADMDQPVRLRQMSSLRRLLGEVVVDGRTLIGVAMATGQGPLGVFYYERDTALLARLETIIAAGPSGQLKVTADFSDYRQVGGIKVPFALVVTNPAMRLMTKIESVELNVPLEDTFFAPRKEE